MDILSILPLLGGIGLFLFGMDLMGSYLTKLAGSSLEKILERFTTGKSRAVGYLKGWGLGASVTAIIQSSAATTIMLMGFVNAGIMKLIQAVPVVMGANVGSTVTAQILRLGDLSGQSLVFRLLRPSAFAPVLVGIGAFILLFSKKKKTKNIAGIMVGLGILFYGMTTMEAVFEPLREAPWFRNLFRSFENPLLGILTGALITAVIQSSSASVGILQALAATGSVTYGTAVPIIIGQNIGKCMTILMGSISAGKEAKRVAASYLFFNLLGAVLFAVPVYLIYYTVGIPLFAQTVNRGNVANLHLIFNLVTSIVLLPFTEKIAAMTGRIIGSGKKDEAEQEFAKLDEMLLKTPTVALNQCTELTDHMQSRIAENYGWAIEMIDHFDEKRLEQMEDNEAFIDRCETVLPSYVIRIKKNRLPKKQRRVAVEILNSVSDLERIGDYSISIAYTARDMDEEGAVFTQAGKDEIHRISEAVDQCLSLMMDAFRNNDREIAMQVEPLADVIDAMKEVIKARHIERLEKGECSVQGGVGLYDLLTCFERISAHATNVALHIIGQNEKGRVFDESHGHVTDVDKEEYEKMYSEYRERYLFPVLTGNRGDASADSE